MAGLATDRIFSEMPPETLYHYTTQSGLLGIVREKSIWATHNQYLNDHQEFIQALKIAEEEIEAGKAAATDDVVHDWHEMLVALRSMSIMNVCVCSFSEEKDSLSQWRAYGGHSSGFALGFSGDLLRGSVSAQSFYMARCIYDPAEQRALIREVVHEVFQENVRRREARAAGTPEPDEEFAPEGGNLSARLLRYAPVIKDKAFKEEKEWRIISRPLMFSNKRFSYREGKSTLIPYYSVAIGTEQSPFGLNEIMVGPTVDPGRAKRAVNGFLINQGYKDVAVNPSQVPYRTW